VQLCDESAGGFRALCEQPVSIAVGTKGLLSAGEDWYEVRLANIQSVESSSLVDEDDGKPLPADFFQSSTAEETASASSSAKPPVCYRLGLARLRDTYNPDLKSSYYSLAGLSCQLRHMGPGSMGIVAVGIVLAIVVAIVPLAGVKIITSKMGDEELKEGIQWADQHKSTISNASASGGSTSLPPLSGKLADLRRTIQHMPGGMPFVLPDVVKQLQLTPSQQSKIQELIDTAADEIKKLGNSIADSAAKTKEILKKTRKKVLELLDDDQKTKWNELTGESVKEEKKEANKK
jgi:hypothetical protein